MKAEWPSTPLLDRRALDGRAAIEPGEVTGLTSQVGARKSRPLESVSETMKKPRRVERVSSQPLTSDQLGGVVGGVVETRAHVSLTYQKITWTHVDGGITASDDWETPIA